MKQHSSKSWWITLEEFKIKMHHAGNTCGGEMEMHSNEISIMEGAIENILERLEKLEKEND